MGFWSDILGKKETCLEQIWIEGEVYFIDKAVARRIHELEKEATDEIFKRATAEDELRKIKPIVERPGFKPVVSSECDSCKYAVSIARGPYGILTLVGCRKDMVCEDYTPKEE